MRIASSNYLTALQSGLPNKKTKSCLPRTTTSYSHLSHTGLRLPNRGLIGRREKKTRNAIVTIRKPTQLQTLPEVNRRSRITVVEEGEEGEGIEEEVEETTTRRRPKVTRSQKMAVKGKDSKRSHKVNRNLRMEDTGKFTRKTPRKVRMVVVVIDKSTKRRSIMMNDC